MKHQYFRNGRFATIHHIKCDDRSITPDISLIIGKVKDSEIQLSHDFVYETFNFPTKTIELEPILVVRHTNPEYSDRIITDIKDITILIDSFKDQDIMILKDNKVLVNINKLIPITNEEKLLFTNLKKESIMS